MQHHVSPPPRALDSSLRRWAPRLLLVALLGQYSAAYLIQAFGAHEPWPALLLPGFAKVPTPGAATDSIPDVVIECDDGTVRRPTAQQLFETIPPSMLVTVLRKLRTTPESPEIERWLLTQAGALLASEAGDPTLVAVELRWATGPRPLLRAAQERTGVQP